MRTRKHMCVFVVGMHVALYVCICVRSRLGTIVTYIHAYIHTYIQAYLHTCTYISAYNLHTYMHTYIHTNIYLAHTFIYENTQLYVYVHIHTHMHINIQAHFGRDARHTFILFTHTYINTYTHTHKYTSELWQGTQSYVYLHIRTPHTRICRPS
jgi:hypothetical protein